MSGISAGYGVCGHKNSFSTGVKIGNYVEDRIGRDLAHSGRSQPLSRSTEANSNYIDPKRMIDKSVHAPKENLEERTLLRAGLPYNLLFEHGRPHQPSREELEKKYTPTSYDFGKTAQRAIPTTHVQGKLRKELEMRKARESREIGYRYVTTSQAIVPALSQYQPLG